ncbi:MAG TPA: HtaA domain-containing protein [Caulobacteraceae bacterium]|jgi:hypothetical protein|nr:HtaA domain-containing protein [Caulobacteraceae bacterium]
MKVQLTWGLKESFRGYVEAAGGAIETGEGASRDGAGAFIFPDAAEAASGEGLSLGDGGGPQGVARFVGQVRFQAHGGMLDVFLADPLIEITADAAVLRVADTPARDRQVHLANLDIAAAWLEDGEWVVPAKLSRDGWQVLGDHYLPSTPLDPVRLRF